MHGMHKRVGGYGGVIGIDKDGNFAKNFNTDMMIWATVEDNVLKSGLRQGEIETEQLQHYSN